MAKLGLAGVQLQPGALDEIGYGADNIVLAAQLRDGSPVMVKVRRGARRARYAVAAWASRQLARADVPAPKILWHDGDICVETWVAGTALDATNIALRERLAAEAGEILRKLHAVPVRGFGQLDPTGRGSDPTLTAWLTRHASGSDASGTRFSPGARVALALRALAPSLHRHPPRLLHGDWVARHVLGSSGRITGVIDLESVRGGDPMADLAGWSLQEPPHLTRAFLAGYGLEHPDDDLRLRLVLHRLRIGTALIAHHLAAANHPRARLHTQQIQADLDDLDAGYLRLTPRITPAPNQPPTTEEPL